jgi:hypothetical protein
LQSASKAASRNENPAASVHGKSDTLLLTDPLERVETFSLHLLRDHLDDHTWQMVAERLAHGFFACVFSDGLLVIWLCNRLLDRLGRLSGSAGIFVCGGGLNL